MQDCQFTTKAHLLSMVVVGATIAVIVVVHGRTTAAAAAAVAAAAVAVLVVADDCDGGGDGGMMVWEEGERRAVGQLGTALRRLKVKQCTMRQALRAKQGTTATDQPAADLVL